MMASNAVPKSITTNTNNIIVDHAVLNVEELIKHQKYHATFCVYRVPKSLSSTKPEAFTPQFVGLGSYHHCLPQLCFDYLKVSAVTSVLNDTNVLTKVVQELSNSNLAPLIRDCYDTSLVFKDDTLLYLMTVDALFLYDFLSSLVIITEEESVDTVTKFDLQVSIFAAKHRMPLVNSAGVELTKDAIIRDFFMLENQIPIHILEEIMRVVFTNMETEGPRPQYEDVGSKMLNLCRAFCPFVYLDQQLPIQSEEAVKHVHLLDLMYHLMVPDPNPTPDEHEPNFNPDEHEPNPTPDEHEAKFNPDEPNLNPDPDENAEQDNRDEDDRLQHDRYRYNGSMKDLLSIIFHFIVWGTTPDGEPSIIEFDGHSYDGIWIVILRLVVILTLPVGCLLFAFSFLVAIIVLLLRLSYPAVVMVHKLLTSVSLPFLQPITILVGIVKRIYGLPLLDSINLDMDVEIPSVTELHQAGMHIHPAYGGISSSGNYMREYKFYLPKIRVDVNSEVIMRNLVAYESLTQSSCLYFTRYVELMRSLIKTVEDVKLMVDEKIIQTEFSDAQVAQLFNEISKSIRPTNTPELDQIINKVIYDFHCLKFRKRAKFMTYYVLPFASATLTAAFIGFCILFFDLIKVTLEGKMPDVIKYITSSVIKVFHWFNFL